MKNTSFFISILFLFLTACEKEEGSVLPAESTIQTIEMTQKSYDIDEIPLGKKKIESILEIARTPEKITAKQATKNESLSLGNIVVENSRQGYHSYSISLLSEELTTNFKNLVIEKTDTKEAAYIITYYPTNSYLSRILEGYTDTPFEGTYEIENLYYDDPELLKISDENITTICITTIVAVQCTAGGNHSPGEECSGTSNQQPRWSTRTNCSTFFPRGPNTTPAPPQPAPSPAPSPIPGVRYGGGGNGYPPDDPSYKNPTTPKYVCQNSDCTKIEIVDPITITPIYQTHIQAIANYFSKSELEWLTLNEDVAFEISRFITLETLLKKKDDDSNTRSEKAIQLAKESVAIMMNNPDMKIDIAKSFASPFKIDLSKILELETEAGKTLTHVYNKLTQTKAFKNLFLDIFGNDSKYTVEFQIVENTGCTTDGDANACTKTTIKTINGTKSIDNNLIRIEFNENYLEQASYANIVKTIVHEAIHANLFLLTIKDENLAFPFSYNSDAQTFADLAEEVERIGQHEYMIRNYVTTMMKNIEEALPLLYRQAQLDYVSDLELFHVSEHLGKWNWQHFYEYFSYTGLHETTYFKENIETDELKHKLFRVYNESAKDELKR